MTTVQTLTEERAKHVSIIHHIDAIIAIIANAGPIAPEPVPTAPPPETHGLPMHRHRKRATAAPQQAVTRTARRTHKTPANLDAPIAADGAPQPTIKDLVREACRRMPEPFTSVDVREYMGKRWPERVADMLPAAVSSPLSNMKAAGELEDAGTKPGLTGPLALYKRGPKFRA